MAIVLVLLCHSVPHAAGGTIGVNIFFTLSGLLITSVMLDEFENKSGISFGRFYARRALRLLPALFALLALVAVLPNDYSSEHARITAILASLFYIGNYVSIFHVGFGNLAHTWSLGVEEQFYFLWPVTLWFLARRGKLLLALPLLIVGLAGLRAISTALAPTGTAGALLGIGSLAANGDQLLCGALLALLLRRQLALTWLKRPSTAWVALAVLAGLTLLGSADNEGTQGTLAGYGLLTVIGIATAMLIAPLTEGGSAIHRLFVFTPFVWLGRVSYGVYLFHFPIFQWVYHQHWSSASTYVAEYALTAVAVTVSWFVIERPALRLKQRWSSRAPAETEALQHTAATI